MGFFFLLVVVLAFLVWIILEGFEEKFNQSEVSLLPCHFNSICDVHPYYNDRIEHWKKYFSGKCNLQPISKRFVGGACQATLTNKRKNGQNCSLALYHRVFFTKNEKKT